MHSRKYAHAARDVRPDRRQLRVHGRRGRRAARLPARANLRRVSRDSARLPAGRARRATSAARTCSPSRRWSGARTSRRCSTAMPLVRQRASGASPRRRRRARLAGPEPRRRGRPAARLRRRRRAGGALPRRGGLRLPLAVRGLRHADRRGDGVRDARRRLGPPSLDEASGDAAVRADPESPDALGNAIQDALAADQRRIASGLEHAARFTARAQGEAVFRCYREAG